MGATAILLVMVIAVAILPLLRRLPETAGLRLAESAKGGGGKLQV